MRQQLPSIGGRRLRWVLLVLVCMMAAFALKLLQYQVIQAPEINKVSFQKRSIETTIPAFRGEIVDAAGNVLAKTVYSYDVNVDPSMVNPFTRTINNKDVEISVQQATQEISDLLKIDIAELSPKLIGTGRYANLAKGVDAGTYRKLRALDIPWVFYDAKPHRIYPNGAVAGNVLGFVGKDGEPLEGLELSMNSCLAGQDGIETYERGVDGIKIPQSAQKLKVAKDGSDLVLTINSDLQYYAQQVMTKYVNKYRANWGSAVIVEAKTGRILAAAEAPTVDPNVYWQSDDADRRSRIFQASFEPGSTMKSLTAATLLEEKQATPNSQVVAPYRLKVLNGTHTIKDSHGHPTTNWTLTGVLAESSNTGIVQLGEKVSAKTRYDYYRKFGLGDVTAVKFSGEAAGIVHKPSETDALTPINAMFGQGITVTPIQSAMIYQTLANKGVRLSPILVEGCKKADGELVTTPVNAPVQVVSAQTARTTIDMLENVVQQGSIGRYAKIPGYRVAGKTGTAEIQDGTGYGTLRAISFIGMAPAEDPQYVLAVTIYKARTVDSSLFAVPAWKEIMEQVLHVYRVPPSATKSPNLSVTWK